MAGHPCSDLSGILRKDTIGNAPDPRVRTDMQSGSGSGSIELVLPKTVYSADERIAGMLLLTLNTPVFAHGLYLILSADQSFREQDRAGIRTISRKICGFQQRLDREKEYPDPAGSHAYPFAITMPPAGITGRARASRYSGTQTDRNLPGPVGPARWVLEGILDVPSGPGIRAGVHIHVPDERISARSPMDTSDGSVYF